MGLFNTLNRLWSQADFWDKSENQSQRNQFAQEDEEKKRREAQARAQALANSRVQQQPQQQQQQQQVQQQQDNIPELGLSSTIGGLDSNILGFKPKTEALAKAPTKTQAKLGKLQSKYTDQAKAEVNSNASLWEKIANRDDLSKQADTIARTRALHEYNQNNKWNKNPEAMQFGADTVKTASEPTKAGIIDRAITPALSIARVAGGVGQGYSGLYDLLTPGKGTNRVSQFFNKNAEDIDQYAKGIGTNGQYKVGNVAGEIGSYLIPGVAGAKAVSKAEELTKVPRLLEKAAQFGDDGGKFSKWGAEAAKELLSPAALSQDIKLNARYTGQDSARGKAITPMALAENAAMSLGGALSIPLLRAGKRLIPGLKDITKRGLDDANLDQLTHRGDNLATDVNQAKTEIADGVKVKTPEPTPRPVVEEPTMRAPIDEPMAPNVLREPTPVRAPEVMAPRDIPSVRVPEAGQFDNPLSVALGDNVGPVDAPLAKAPQVPQVIDDVPNFVEPTTPEATKLQKSVEQVRQNIDEAPKPKGEVADIAEPAPRAEAKVQAQEAPKTVPVDKQGKIIKDVESQATPAEVKAKKEGVLTTDTKTAIAPEKPTTPKTEVPKPLAKGAIPAPKKPLSTTSDPLANLKQEALKYKSADEFVRQIERGRTTWGTPTTKGLSFQNAIDHRPYTLDKLSHADTIKYTGGRSGLQNETITVYRVTPSKTISAGDMVFHDLSDAQHYAKQQRGITKGGITSMEIKSSEYAPAFDTNTQINNRHLNTYLYKNEPVELSRIEGVYVPENSRSVDLTDIYNQAHAKPTTPKAEVPKPLAKGDIPAPVAKTKSVENRVQQALDKENPLQYKNLSGEERKAYSVEKAKLPQRPTKTPQSELPKTESGGLAKTGETGKSKGKFSKGQEFEKTSMEAVREQGKAGAANTSFKKFVDDVGAKDSFTDADRSTAVELQKRFKPGTAEHRALGDLVNKSNTSHAQAMATIEKTIRKEATGKQLSDRFTNKIYKVLDADQTIDKSTFDDISKANNEFVQARDNTKKAYEAFQGSPTKATAKAYEDAHMAEVSADRASKFMEYDTAGKLTAKTKNPKVEDFVNRLGKEAGVYSMDNVDASFLSSSRVMINNYLNGLGVKNEEKAFGGIGAKIAKRLTGETIGGYNRQGAKLGKSIGTDTIKAEAALRQSASGNKLMKSLRNFATTGNTLGDRNLYATAYADTYSHYLQDLKKAGYTGEELVARTRVATLADPDDVGKAYMHTARVGNALESTTTFRNRGKFETALTNTMAEHMGNSKAAKSIAKAVTRVTVGYPTVIARSVKGGIRRSTLGGIDVGQAIINASKGGDTAVTALHIKNAVKSAGSGAVMMGMGAALYQKGLITTGYPSDKDEQAAWKREGKQEYSLKVGGHWFDLASPLGVFALPLFIGAQGSQNVSEGKPVTDNAVGNIIKTVINATPVDSLSKNADFLKRLGDAGSGNTASDKGVARYLAQTGSGLVRAATPIGGMINEVAQMFNPHVNDTTKGDLMAQFLAKVKSGVPGLSNTVDAKIVEGKVIENTNPIARFFGSSNKEQSGGVQKSQQIQSTIDGSVKTMHDYNTFNDNIRNVLDDTQKAIFDKAKSGQKLDESDLKGLSKAITKNVSSTSDSRYLENGDYDSNLAALKIKRDMLSADPTTRKDTLDEYDTNITRGKVYKSNKVPYKLVKSYREVGLTDWRKMGDPKSDEYDPEHYNQLKELDDMMAEKGVSRKGDGSRNKYYDKTRGGGRGRSRGGRSGGRSSRSSSASGLDSSVLGLGSSSSKGNKYIAIDKPKSYIPDLKTKNYAKTNLKKKITVQKGVKYI